MVHLRPRISDDLDIFWEELVAVLLVSASVGEPLICLECTYKTKQSWELSLYQLATAPKSLSFKITYSLLLCKISRGSENDNHGVILQLDVSGGAKNRLVRYVSECNIIEAQKAQDRISSLLYSSPKHFQLFRSWWF